ncbi:MAG: PD40 domain-containing protein, partial [Planctomycetes bacterium]|nr:PD40 domain-containing protein [Planctomycetota bacterium]
MISISHPDRRCPRLSRVCAAAWLALAIGALATGAPAQDTLLDTIPPGYELAGAPVFSPDGKRVAYAAATSEGRTVVVDGEASEATTFADSPVFSADGRHVAYRAGRSLPAGVEQWRIVKDGKKLDGYAWVGPPAITPNGDRVAHWARNGGAPGPDGTGTAEGYFVVFNGKKGAVHPGGDTMSPPVLSPDGRQVGYRALVDHKWFVVAGKHTSPPYPHVGEPAFAPDGRFAYPVCEDAGWCLVREKNGRNSTFDFVGRPVFAPQGKSLAHAACSAGRWFVVLDDRRLPGEYDAVGTPVFSASGREVAYRANRGGSVPGAGIPGLGREAPPDASRIQGGKWLVVVGKIESREFEQVGEPVFSPDGEFVAHAG